MLQADFFICKSASIAKLASSVNNINNFVIMYFIRNFVVKETIIMITNHCFVTNTSRKTRTKIKKLYGIHFKRKG